MTKKSTMRLAEARVRFIDRQEARGYSRETIRTYNSLLGRLIRDLGDLQMASITRRHVENWVYGLRGAHRTDQHGRSINPGIGPSTFNQTVSCLRVFFRWCQAEGYVQQDLTSNLSLIKIPKKSRQQPTPHMLISMLESATFPRDRAYLAVAMNTALRQSEIVRLTIGDVDLDSGYIRVVIPKTGDVDDQPISSDLDGELRRWFIAYQKDIGRPLRPEDSLFPSTRPPQILTRDPSGRIVNGPRHLNPDRSAQRMEKVVQAAMQAVGLPTNGEGTHTIRRAVARAYFDAVSQDQGDVAALRETAALLHHSNLHTTERYLGFTAEKARRDRRIKGQPLLSAMTEVTNVVSLRAVGDE